MEKQIKTEDNGWNQYGKLVLNEINRLNNNMEHLSKEIQDIKNEIMTLKTIQPKLNEINKWQENMSKIISVNQLNDMVHEIEDLKRFKTKFSTIFAITQFAISTAIVLLSIFLK